MLEKVKKFFCKLNAALAGYGAYPPPAPRGCFANKDDYNEYIRGWLDGLPWCLRDELERPNK